MPQNRLAVVLVTFCISLALVPALVAAETFTLPSETFQLESWEWWAACVEPQVCWYHNYGVAYSPDAYLVYRVLINPDGSRQILDIAPVHDDVHNYDSYYYHSLSARLPELTVELTEPGDYAVEVRKITTPSPTASHASSFTPDSTVEWWVADKMFRDRVPGADCQDAWGDNCWLVRDTGKKVRLSDISELHYWLPLTVEGLPAGPENDAAALSGRPSGLFLSNPFSDDNGTAAKSDAGIAGMALAGTLAIGAIGAGLYLVSSYTDKNGNVIRKYATAAGKANDAAVLAEKKKIIRMDEEFAERNRQYNLKKQMAAQSAALAAQQAAQSDRSKQLEADLANIQNSKSYADAGSSYALLAAKYSDILTDDGKKQLMQASSDAWDRNATATAPTIVTASYVSQQLAAPITADTGSTSKRNSLADDAAAFFSNERNAYDTYKKARQNTGLLDSFMDWGQQQVDRTYGFLGAGKDFAVGTITLLGDVVTHPVEYLTLLNTLAYRPWEIGLGIAQNMPDILGGLKTRYITDDHPGIGEGRLAFDVASLVVPVGGGAKVVKGAEEARGLTLAKDVVQVNGKEFVAMRTGVSRAELLTATERLHLNGLLPRIGRAAGKAGVDFQIAYEWMSDAFAAATRNKLYLDASKSIKDLLSRKTLEHEIGGHIKIFQERFLSEEAYAKYMNKVRELRKGATSWLDENEANSMIRNVYGNKVFKERVKVLANDVKDWLTFSGKDVLTKSEFIENYASIQNLVEKANLNNLMKDLNEIRSGILQTGKVTPAELNKAIELMSQNTNNIFNGVVISEKEMIKASKQIVKMLY
jgi:hypothetical protein